MAKSLMVGIIVVALLAVVSAFQANPNFFQSSSLIVGIIGMLGAGVFSGGFVSGDRYRANVSAEDQEDRQERLKWAGMLFLFGLPGILAALALRVLN